MELKFLERRDSNHEVDEKIMYESEIRQLEANFKEAIEALKEISIRVIEGNYPVCLDRVSDSISIIEKAYDESWDKIRRKGEINES